MQLALRLPDCWVSRSVGPGVVVAGGVTPPAGRHRGWARAAVPKHFGNWPVGRPGDDEIGNACEIECYFAAIQTSRQVLGGRELNSTIVVRIRGPVGGRLARVDIPEWQASATSHAGHAVCMGHGVCLYGAELGARLLLSDPAPGETSCKPKIGSRHAKMAVLISNMAWHGGHADSSPCTISPCSTANGSAVLTQTVRSHWHETHWIVPASMARNEPWIGYLIWFETCALPSPNRPLMQAQEAAPSIARRARLAAASLQKSRR